MSHSDAWVDTTQIRLTVSTRASTITLSVSVTSPPPHRACTSSSQRILVAIITAAHLLSRLPSSMGKTGTDTKQQA